MCAPVDRDGEMTEGQAKLLRRSDVVAAARSWIGTPYHHQASTKGIGTDCLGLVRGIYREIYGFEAEQPPAYSADWAEALGTETLLEAASRHLCAKSREHAEPGDILVFRMHREARAKHLAVLTEAASIVHAVEGTGTCEVPLTGWWRRRIARVFSFPDIQS